MNEDPRPATDVPGVLVVDDDPVLRDLLNAVLTARGFRVWVCPSGEEALAVYLRHRNQIALALLDVRMPGLDGPGTLSALRRIDPGVRACFMSGHTDPYSLDDLAGRGALRFFEKPFQITALADGLWQLATGEVRQTA
jgi:DNA-binding NtrC family response regulator